MLSRILNFYGQIKDGVVLVLLVSVIVLFGLKERLSNRLEVCQAEAAKAEAEYLSTIESARATALSLKMDQERKDRERQEEADRRYESLSVAYTQRLQDYIKSRSSATSYLPRPSGPSEGSDRPSEDTVLPSIGVSEDDLLICTENTARLVSIHEWTKQ